VGAFWVGLFPLVSLIHGYGSENDVVHDDGFFLKVAIDVVKIHLVG